MIIVYVLAAIGAMTVCAVFCVVLVALLGVKWKVWE